jgi:hypothetical protein
MKAGNIVTWPWQLKADSWEATQMQGLIVDSRLWKTDYEKVRLLVVFLTDGDIVEIREDQVGLELMV